MFSQRTASPGLCLIPSGRERADPYAPSQMPRTEILCRCLRPSLPVYWRKSGFVKSAKSDSTNRVFTSRNDVKGQVRNIVLKLNAHDCTDAATIALKHRPWKKGFSNSLLSSTSISSCERLTSALPENSPNRSADPIFVPVPLFGHGEKIEYLAEKLLHLGEEFGWLSAVRYQQTQVSAKIAD